MKFCIIYRFDVYIRISYNILYGIKYMITNQILYEGLDNVFVFTIFKLFPSSSPKLYLLHFKICFDVFLM